jgi:wobble nucleotide-excising tRNase
MIEEFFKMSINSIKRLSVFSAIFAFATILNGVVLAASVPPSTSTQPASTTPNSLTAHQKIKLTSQQRQQIEVARQQRDKDIEALLNPSQDTKFKAALQSRQRIRIVLKTLDLNQAQQKQVQSILQTYNQQVKQILSSQASQPTSNSVGITQPQPINKN